MQRKRDETIVTPERNYSNFTDVREACEKLKALRLFSLPQLSAIRSARKALNDCRYTEKNILCSVLLHIE